ncbi:MAG TPA: hypothetical protein VFH38_08500 [Jatrophihabitans sp.]|nr:hypothetical protein [Jatrophihabitans sp.]
MSTPSPHNPNNCARAADQWRGSWSAASASPKSGGVPSAGEQALRDWQESSSAPTQIQSEALLKLFLAGRDDAARMRVTVAELGQDAERVLGEFAAMASGASQFPERMPTNVVSMRLMAEMYAALRRWSQWAADAVDVLEHGSAEAVEHQTRQALDAICAAGAVCDERPDTPARRAAR